MAETPRTFAPVEAAPEALPSKWPVLTAALSIILIAVFAVQRGVGGVSASPLSFDLRTAVAWGGISHYLVLHEHEWWRIFIAPWLHASLSHLIGNLITLIIAGAILERRIGQGWLAAIYLIGGIAGSIGSIALNDAITVGVGASGAIMALVTCVFALSYHVTMERQAKRLRRLALFVIVPALAPSVADGGAQIDVAAHFGGFVAGFVLTFVLLGVWDESKPAPPWRTTAAGAAAIGGCAVLISLFQVVAHYPIYAARTAMLVPISQLNERENIERDVLELSHRYPHDPAVRLLLAADSLRTHYYQDAEAQARAGLAEHDLLATQFSSIVEQRLQMVLAVALLAERRTNEAIEAARPLCGLSGEDRRNLVAILKKADLCN